MADYDKLTIKIVANTTNAIDSIKTLSSRLDNLKDQADKMDFGRLKELQSILQEIANIDFTKTSNSLYSLVKSFESLNTRTITKVGTYLENIELPNLDLGGDVGEQFEVAVNGFKEITKSAGEATSSFANFSQETEELSNVLTPTVEQMTEFLQKLELISLANNKGVLGGVRDLSKAFIGLGDNVKIAGHNFADFETNIHKLSNTWNGFDATLEPLGNALAEIGLNGSQMETIFKALGTEISSLTPKQIKEVEKAMTDLGYSAEETAKTIELVEKASKISGNGLSKLATKFKSLALYRVMRLVLMEIQKAFQQAIQDLAKYDKDFNTAMSQLTSAFSNIARSLLTMVAPLIKALAPIIKALSDVIVVIANSIGRLFAGILGQDTFVSATDSVKEYNKELDRTKKLTLGIDELNVLQDKDAANGDLFSTEDISNAGGMLGEVSEGFTSFIEKLKGIGKILQPIFDILDTLLGLFKSLFDYGSEQAKVFGEIIGWLFEDIGLGLQNFAKLFKAITSLLTGDWNGFCDNIKGLFFGSINFILAGFEHFINFFIIAINGITSALSLIWTWTGLPAIPEIPRVSLPRISAYANGGFVEDGLFLANHGELIGKFSNGETAVANNEQIIEGIKQGVYEAMIMAGNGDEKGGTQVVVYLDSNEIAKRVEQRSLARKDNNIVGGYKYGS